MTEPKTVTVALELQSSSSLLTVLATVARLGGQLSRIHAVESRAVLSVRIAPHLAHRIVPCLGQVIGVLSVREGTTEALTPEPIFPVFHEVVGPALSWA
jgi:hypothetical protein